MGVNPSEEHLGALSRQTFLSFWSYSNPFFDKGKELCDVLIIFGNDVIVMSDKTINYNEDKPREVAWTRWYKKAVTESIRQLRGAIKTIKERPSSIYLDAKLSSPFPLNFPQQPRFHLVAIANGSEEVCQREHGSPSLTISNCASNFQDSLSVGVFFPEFVHVLNRTALDALFFSLDTTADLIDYLQQKEQLFRERENVWIRGEEDLIALYVRSRWRGLSGGLAKNSVPEKEGGPAARVGEWGLLINSSEYESRHQSLKKSYLVDNVIEQLASEYQSGRMLIGQNLGIEKHAEAFSRLASESRMGRLLIGDALFDVFTEDENSFWTVAVESPRHSKVIYVWLIYPIVPDYLSDENLEFILQRELSKYLYVAMGKFPYMHEFYGVAMANSKSHRTSRVFRNVARNIWDEEMQQESENISKSEGVFSDIQSSILSYK